MRSLWIDTFGQHRAVIARGAAGARRGVPTHHGGTDNS